MPRVEVVRAHCLGLDEARARMRVLADGFQKDYPAMVSDLAWSPDETSATAKGKGFKAAFSVTESEIVVRVELSMLLGAMKGRVKARLEEKLTAAVS